MLHHSKNFAKLDEILPLLRFEFMMLEERNDSVQKMFQTSHAVGHAVSVVRAYDTTPEEILECVQKLDVPFVLHNGEFRKDLNLRYHFRMRINADEETAFSIDESGNPLCIKFHWSGLNVKSLRVLHCMIAEESSLRIAPMSSGLLLPRMRGDEYRKVFEEFPAYSSV